MTSGPDPQLVTLGETMALLSHARPSPLRHAKSLGLDIGGSESNVAIAAARLGVRSAWIGQVGADEFGRMVVRELRAEGVEVHARVNPDRPTALMIKAARSSRSTEVSYYRSGSAGAALQPGDIDAQLLRNAQVFHTSAITAALSDSAHEAVHRCIEICKASQTLVSIDLNYRRALWSEAAAREEFARLAAVADVIFATEAEARIVCAGDSPSQLATELARLGARAAFVKLGERGAVACIDGELRTIAPVTVNAIDTVGAGDAFAAGYLAATIKGRTLDEALGWATLMGAWSVATSGDWQGLPDEDELPTLMMRRDDVTR